jgi:Cupredoxin-like domain
VPRLVPFAALSLLLVPAAVLAANPQFSIALKAHEFVPRELEIPAGTKVELRVRNNDRTPAEFESTALHREEVVVGGGEIRVFVGPLDPGRYEFFDDFHPETRGALVAK